MGDGSPIRVLIVDDSLFYRRTLSRIIGEFGITAEARNGQEALSKIQEFHPHVVLLDIEMPVMDGLDTLKEIMARYPLPVVIISGTTKYGAGLTLSCLEMGALDFIVKPKYSGVDEISSIKVTIRKTLLTASATHVKATRLKALIPNNDISHKDGTLSAAASRIVAIATSTGGPPALYEVLSHLPNHLNAGILVVQHMPPVFTGAMAQRLDNRCILSVKEAQEDDLILNNRVLIAPGGFHMRISDNRRIQLSDAPPVWGVRPAADPLMNDAAHVYGSSVLGIVLTGMGCDGTEGLRTIKQQGGYTIAQDEETCLIFGMPRSAIAGEVVDKVVPLSEVAREITTWCQLSSR